ncbi:MAG: hypothetical protein ABSG84_13385 [Acidobacteriaceae bacterium]|jgi:hypothetical protein
MRRRSQIALLALSLLLSSAAALPQAAATAQDTQVTPAGNVSLRFSHDGSLLRVIGESPGDNQSEHVRAVTYAVKSGVLVHAVNLPADTNIQSVTSDGATAVVSANASTNHPHLSLLDTATGQLQPIPESWYQPDSDMDAAISGDGRFISIYSETESATPMTVTVYDWQTKTLVATRTSAFVAAGGIVGGGVTEDGEVEFDGNRVGSTIVDLKSGRVMAQFGPSSLRSPNGAWAVEFPNLSWDESASRDFLLKDGKTGRTLGKLDIHLPDSELFGDMIYGAFCGATPRFIVAGDHSVAAYALPSGKLLASFPASTWKDASAEDTAFASVACSPAGTRVAILSGTRLTFHDLK